MPIRRLRLIHAPSSDWERLREFYRDVLRLPETGGWDLPGDRGAFLAAGEAEVELMEQDLASAGVLDTPASGWQLALEVDDLDAEHARLAAAGVELLRGIREHPWGSRDFVARDPAGNLVLIYSDPARPEE
ncbi:MAG: VOC family protein [Armatimonadota bacterium]